MRSPTHLMNKPVTLTRVTFLEAPADDGTPQTTETTEAVSIAVFPGAEAETGNVQVDTRLVFIPPNLDVSGVDRLTFDGGDWQLIGTPEEFAHPRTLDPIYARATVKRIT